RATPLLGSFDFTAPPSAPLLLQPHPCPIAPSVSITGAAQGGARSQSSNVITMHDVPVIARVTPHGTDLLVTVQSARGRQTYTITPAMRVLGRSGRFLDRLAMRPGDILLRQGSMVQDESADSVMVRGRLAQVEVAQGLVVLQVPTTQPGSAALRIAHPARRSNVILVLLTPSTRVRLPSGLGLADLEPGPSVQVTGTLNWRTDTLLRPTSLVVGVVIALPPCTILPAAGEQDCAGKREQ
ncbi:MAG TPA: hypothetical protein VHB98_23035, partial [Chloroflexota bacterium]|nr:hypothetical protein [Chloroflexota bacterium]